MLGNLLFLLAMYESALFPITCIFILGGLTFDDNRSSHPREWLSCLSLIISLFFLYTVLTHFLLNLFLSISQFLFLLKWNIFPISFLRVYSRIKSSVFKIFSLYPFPNCLLILFQIFSHITAIKRFLSHFSHPQPLEAVSKLYSSWHFSLEGRCDTSMAATATIHSPFLRGML